MSTSSVLIFLGAFLASAVEMVEALTIVLGVGIVRGWRAPLIGMQVLLGEAGSPAAAGRPGSSRIPPRLSSGRPVRCGVDRGILTREMTLRAG